MYTAEKKLSCRMQLTIVFEIQNEPGINKCDLGNGVFAFSVVREGKPKQTCLSSFEILT